MFLRLLARQIHVTSFVAVFVVAALGCGGGGGGPGNGNDQTTGTDVMTSEGPPTMFSIECTRHAREAGSEDWQAQDGFVRVEAWIYARSGGAEVISLVNNEVIDRTQTSNDYSRYPSPGIDPRVYGCGEPKDTVERVLGGTQLLTSEGTAAASDMNLGAVQLLMNYYTVNGAASGVHVTYANGQMVAMETL